MGVSRKICCLFVLGELTTSCGPSAPNFSGQHVVGINMSLTGVVIFFFRSQTIELLEFPNQEKPLQFLSMSLSVQRLNESTDIIEG